MASTPSRPVLPLDDIWDSPEHYVDSLLQFVTGSTAIKNLCGGIHILDFLTRSPDLYSTVLPLEWREWFNLIDVHDLLQVILRADTRQLKDGIGLTGATGQPLPTPPDSFLEYAYTVRIHTLIRSFDAALHKDGTTSHPTKGTSSYDPELPRNISVGMKPKKMHEVSHFAAHVAELSSGLGVDNLKLVDFGAGQNYLGRALASPPYNRHIIAIESKHHNVDGARELDVQANLAKKEKIMRNKKEYKRRLAKVVSLTDNGLPTPPSEDLDFEVTVPDEVLERLALEANDEGAPCQGSMTHIEHEITDGELESIVYPGVENTELKPNLMTISLHSCGNLTHHALRSILNPSVRAVAAIGCCYNLLTERVGPLTYKHPQLRPLHPRLVATSTAYDPQGFPMSKRLEDYVWSDNDGFANKGVRMNITARMMAVQAPANWGREDSEAFFTRHFYRALFQKVLLDRGVVKSASSSDNAAAGGENEHTPFIVGSLKKSAFQSFPAYIKAALAKLTAGAANDGEWIKRQTSDLTDHVATEYEKEFGHHRKHLALIWTLMAYSAGVVESLIATDRWLWLREQDCVGQAWVEAVFNYQLSPRNLCVVGIKKHNPRPMGAE